MIELLAIPAWNTPPRTLGDWADALAALGHQPTIGREHDDTWLEVAPLRLRGYVATEGQSVEAINFELHAQDTEPASRILAAAAQSLGWELHPDEPEEDNVDED